MPDQPTYYDIAKFAAALNDKDHGFYGLALRGQPGWGENMATVDTMANSFGASWFDMQWHPTLDTPAWKNALSTYENPEYQKKAPFAEATLKAMQTADPTNPCVQKVPYTGITFVGIPEFQSLGTTVGQNVAGLVTGKTSLEQTLQLNQNEAERTMKQAGYLK